jgi:hypothetical protein
MKSLLLLPVIIAISSAALAAEPTCTAPKDKWMKEADFKHTMQQQGYKIKTLKVTNGCYEIYGHDKNGKRVEMSFDPVTAIQAK